MTGVRMLCMMILQRACSCVSRSSAMVASTTAAHIVDQIPNIAIFSGSSLIPTAPPSGCLLWHVLHVRAEHSPCPPYLHVFICMLAADQHVRAVVLHHVYRDTRLSVGQSVKRSRSLVVTYLAQCQRDGSFNYTNGVVYGARLLVLDHGEDVLQDHLGLKHGRASHSWTATFGHVSHGEDVRMRRAVTCVRDLQRRSHQYPA